jgi:hypothetical protein
MFFGPGTGDRRAEKFLGPLCGPPFSGFIICYNFDYTFCFIKVIAARPGGKEVRGKG